MENFTTPSIYWRIFLFICNILITFSLKCGSKPKLNNRSTKGKHSTLPLPDDVKSTLPKRKGKKDSEISKKGSQIRPPEPTPTKLSIVDRQKMIQHTGGNQILEPSLSKKKTNYNIKEYNDKKEVQKLDRNELDSNKSKKGSKRRGKKGGSNKVKKESFKKIKNKKGSSRPNLGKLSNPILFQQVKNVEEKPVQNCDENDIKKDKNNLQQHDKNDKNDKQREEKEINNEKNGNNNEDLSKLLDPTADSISGGSGNKIVESNVNERETSTVVEPSVDQFQDVKLENDIKMEANVNGNSLNQETKLGNDVKGLVVEPLNGEMLNNNESLLPNKSNTPPCLSLPKTPSKKGIRELDKEKLQKALKLKNPRVFMNKTQHSTTKEVNSDKNENKNDKPCNVIQSSIGE
uniref:Uncharacterized protein n=1 Tax=Strongyloides stercoralis TaxID=6248 RepID=A0A0K0E1A0_STRER